MTRRDAPKTGPDFIVMGAPKAGTTALHAALTQHPEVFMSNPKEPKYWLCDDAPPRTGAAPATGTPSRSGSGGARTTSGSSRRRPRAASAARARRSTCGTARPAPDRRAPARSQADRGRPRPDRPGLQQLDAPVVRRPRAGRRLRGGVRQAARADRQGLGAVLALRRARSVRRAARAPLQLRRPAARARPALPHHRRRPARGRRPHLRLPRDHARSGRLDPARQQPQLRRAGTAISCHRPAAAGRRPGRAVRPAGGVAPRQRPAPAPARQRRGDPAQALGGGPRRLLPYFADDIALLAQITGEDFDDWLSTKSRGRSRNDAGCRSERLAAAASGRT